MQFHASFVYVKVFSEPGDNINFMESPNVQATFNAWLDTDINYVINNSPWFLIPIILLSIVLFFLLKKKGKEHLDGYLHKISIIAFNLIGLLEFWYLVMAGENFFWFLTPYAGWLALVYIALSCFAAWVQAKSYFILMSDIQSNANVRYNFKWAIWAMIAAIPSMIIARIWSSDAMTYTFMAFILLQLIHVLIIFLSVLKSVGLLYAIAGSLTYVAGCIPVLLLIIPVAIIVSTLFITVKFVILLISIISFGEKNKPKSKTGYHREDPYHIFYN